MNKERFTLSGSNGRPFLVEIVKKGNDKQPLLIFAHGFKGFMDWGHFPLLSEKLAENGIATVRFNFSHNGTTIDAPTDFADLEAFGKNTYSKELYDLDIVLNYFYENADKYNIDKDNVILMGHSRGGAIVLLKAAVDPRVKKVITLAAVSRLDYKWTDEELQQWKNEGVIYVYNSRTKQNMPLYIDLVEDYYDNKELLDMKTQIPKIKVPILVLHGDEDTSVPFEHAEAIASANPNAKLVKIVGANHTFGGKHPYTSDELPEHTKEVLGHILDFIA